MNALEKTKLFFQQLEEELSLDYSTRFELFSNKIKKNIEYADIKCPENSISFAFNRGFMHCNFLIFFLHNELPHNLSIQRFFKDFFSEQLKYQDTMITSIDVYKNGRPCIEFIDQYSYLFKVKTSFPAFSLIKARKTKVKFEFIRQEFNGNTN